MNKLLEKRNNLYAEAQKLVGSIKTENRSLTDDEKTKYDSLVAEIKSIDESMKADKELRELNFENAEPKKETGADVEERAFESYLRSACNGIEKRDANMTFGANGAVIPNTIMNKVIDKVVNISPLFSMATKYTVKGNVSVPYIDTTGGDVTVAFAEEFSTLTASAFKFKSITLKGYLAACLVLLSKQLINNSQIDVVGYVVDKMAEKIAVFIENFLINGDTSINTKSGLKNSVTQIYSLTDGKITADALIDVQDTIPDVYQSGACWIMSPKTRTAIRKLKDGQGNYLLVNDFSKNTNYSLLGKPVYVTDNIKDTAEKGKTENIIYYGDFSGLAVKLGEGAEIQTLIEKYAEQHAIGLNAWFEMDNTVENAQKIVAAAVPAV